MLFASVLSAVMVPVCLVALPESLSFVSKKSGDALAEVNRVLRKIGHAPVAGIKQPSKEAASYSVRDLLGPEFRKVSLGLWAGLACTFTVMYFLLSWIPIIALESGLPANQAIVAGAVFSGGGFLGVAAAGFFANRYGYARSIAAYSVIACIMMIVYSVYRDQLAIILLIALVMGCTVQGAVGAFYGAAARAYPVELKATGVGWTIGIGRVGAIVGPYFGGILLSQGYPQLVNFSLYGLVMLLAAAAMLPLRKII